MKKTILLIWVMVNLIACQNTPNIVVSQTPDCQKLQAKADIEAIQRTIKDCTKRQDIEGFMASCDDTFILESNEPADKDRIIAKDTLKADILQSWSIINKIHEVEQWVDSMHLQAPDTAIVFTNQFFHRTFKKPNNLPGEDDIISTQRHREVWIKRGNNWKQSRIRELGGFIYVNGKPYNPN